MGLLLAGGVGLILWQLIGGDGPDTTTVSALLAGVIGLIGLFNPDNFIALGKRITHIEALGLKVELRVQEAKRAVAQFEDEEDGATPEPPDWPASNKKATEKIADKLRGKLRFSSTVLFDRKGDGIAEEMIVITLGTEGLLPYNEVMLCQDLLGDFYTELDELEEDDRIAFLDASWAFAVRFATRVFDRHARRRLEASGWKVADFSQGRGHRADFIVAHEEVTALVAARVAAPKKNLQKTADRLRRVKFPLPDLRRVIVVPDHVDHLPKKIDEGPMKIGEDIVVVRLHHLASDPKVVISDLGALPELPLKAATGDS